VFLGWASFEFITFPYSRISKGTYFGPLQFRAASRQALKAFLKKIYSTGTRNCENVGPYVSNQKSGTFGAIIYL